MRQIFIASILALTLTGCATYLIPIDSFKHQFNGIDSTKLRKVESNIPVIFYGSSSYSYLANPIDTIDCVTEDGKPVRLVNSPSIEVRFTERNDDRTIFYFDTVYLQDSLIVGAKSRYIPSLRDAIPINNIKLIEVQDGKKDFHYVKQSK